MVPLCIIAYLAIGPVAARWFPKYLGGVEAARINAISGLGLISMGPSVLFGVLRRNTPYVIGTALALAVFWLIGWFVLPTRPSIEAVAWLRCGIGIGLGLFAIIAAHRMIGQASPVSTTD